MVQSGLKRLRDSGRIVNICSVTGTWAMPVLPIYTMVKAAIT